MTNINPQVVVSGSNGSIPGTTRNEGELVLDLSTRTLWALTSGSPTATRIGPNSAGSGTVTNNEGTLALGQLVIGNGGSDEQTLGSYGTVGQILTSAGPGVAPGWSTSAAALNFSDSEIPSGTINGINSQLRFGPHANSWLSKVLPQWSSPAARWGFHADRRNH